MLTTLNKPRQTTHPTLNQLLNGQGQPQFERLLQLVDVVSFDLFDTLVQREGLFSPKDLFYQVHVEAERRLGFRVDDFATLRVRAEEIARVRARGRGVEEVTLDEIYAELGRLMHLESGALQRLKDIELDCDRSALTIRESGQRLFKVALAAGKIIVIISDTYFDAAFITEIVTQQGYGDVRKVYASSAYGKTKVEGSLYDLVLKDLRCAPGKLLHVGDNQLSDVTMALNKGIRTFFLPTPKQQLKWRHGLGDRPSGNLAMSAILCDLSQRYEQAVPNEAAQSLRRPNFRSFQNFGSLPNISDTSAQDSQSVIMQTAIQNLSLLYFGYSAWLVEQLRNQGYQRVYFAARDGLIMKRFFDLTAAAAGFEIDSRYLYISRAALYPSLIFTDPTMARRLFCHNWDHLTLKEALERLSLTFEESVDLLAQHRLANRKLQLGDSTVTRFAAFLGSAWPMLERKHETNYQLVVEYLRQEMVLTEERAAFVDIGWHGSLQHCLLKLLKHLGIAKELSGYYLGTFNKPLGAPSDFRSTGFLIDNNEPHWISHLIRSGPSVIELFHSAGHGSVLGYQRRGAGVAPILEDNPEEQEQFLQLIEPVQNQAFNFVAEQLEHLPGVMIKAPDPGLVVRTALRVIYAPTAAEAATFGRLRMASDFGGRMKSITGMLEWNLKKIKGDVLPDGRFPMWWPGFQVLKSL